MLNTTAPKNTLAPVAALIAGPTVTALGMAITPWETERTTAAYQAALAADPLQGQLAALTLILGYGLLGLTSLVILGRSRAKAPRVLWTIAAILAFLGATVLPGSVVVDFYDLSLAQTLPEAQAVAVADHVHDLPLAIVPQVLGGLGYALGGLVLMLTAWRGRLVGGWAPIALLAMFVLPGILISGPAGIIVGSFVAITPYAGIAVRLRRGARGADRAPAAERAAVLEPRSEVVAHLI